MCMNIYYFARSRPERLSLSYRSRLVPDVQQELKLKMAVALLSEMSHPHGDLNTRADSITNAFLIDQVVH